MINRRQLLFTLASAALLPGAAVAGNAINKKLSWFSFQQQMKLLADERLLAGSNRQAISEQGIQLLKKLDISSSGLKVAVENSYESGNRYWLWQRLMKTHNINGGILNIDNEQMVQLHDHPGATGMVRIISGKAEVWQFDEFEQNHLQQTQGLAELQRFSHGILKAGDTAVLMPGRGSIHALKSVTKECRMLDFFIPPYEKSERSWFEPLEKNWGMQEKILCKKIPQHAYSKA